MTISPEDRKTWTYAFLILLVVALTTLTGRLLNTPLLAIDFEVTIIYLPTIIAGLIMFYVNFKPH